MGYKGWNIEVDGESFSDTMYITFSSDYLNMNSQFLNALATIQKEYETKYSHYGWERSNEKRICDSLFSKSVDLKVQRSVRVQSGIFTSLDERRRTAESMAKGIIDRELGDIISYLLKH